MQKPYSVKYTMSRQADKNKVLRRSDKSKALAQAHHNSFIWPSKLTSKKTPLAHADKTQSLVHNGKNRTTTQAHNTKTTKHVTKNSAVGLKHTGSYGNNNIPMPVCKSKSVRPRHTSQLLLARGAYQKQSEQSEQKKKTLLKPAFYATVDYAFGRQQAPRIICLFLLPSLIICSNQIVGQVYSNIYSGKARTPVISEASSAVSGLTVAGLSAVKKLLLNRVCAVNNVLVPSYNRRSHSISHINSLMNQQRKVSKTFGYIAMKTLRFWIGLALTTCYGSFPGSDKLQLKSQNIGSALQTNYEKYTNSDLYFCNGKGNGKRSTLTKNQQFLSDSRSNFNQKPTVLLMDTIETRAAVLLWRTQMCKSVFHAKQVINHQQFKWVKQSYPLELFRQSVTHSPNVEKKSTKKSTKLETGKSFKSNFLCGYYPVARYSNWVYCGSTLRLLSKTINFYDPT